MLLTLALTTVVAACGPAELTDASTPGGAQGVAVTVTPDALSLAATASATFQATVTGSAITAVTWSIQEGSTGGTVTSAGVYTAPSAAGTYHLVAKSIANPGVTSEATIAVSAAVTPPPPPPPPTGTYPPDVPWAAMTMPALAEPALLGSASFSDLGTKVVHVSDGQHQYAKDTPWNSDQTLAMLVDGSILDGKTYKYIRTTSGNRPNEHRAWANTDPRYIYGVNTTDKSWSRTDATASSPVRTVLATYPSASSVSFGNYEGSIDNGDNYASLIINGTTIYLIEAKTGAKVCEFTPGGSVDNSTLSQDGKYVMTQGAAGIVAYSTPLLGGPGCVLQRQLSSNTGSHWDACVSTAGEQVIVGENDSGRWRMIRISDRQETALYSPGGYQIHVSCRNIRRPGWVYVSTFGRAAYATAADSERIFAVKLDGSNTVENFGWAHFGPGDVPYDYETSAAPSPDGARVWWKAGWDGATAVHSYVAGMAP